MGQLLDRAMQKHIITTIQQEKAEENKEKNLKGHRRRRNTNGCVAIYSGATIGLFIKKQKKMKY